MIGKQKTSIEERQVQFQVGVTLIGQPIYIIHTITASRNKYGKEVMVGSQSQDIG
jgi:hypothetical protein